MLSQMHIQCKILFVCGISLMSGLQHKRRPIGLTTVVPVGNRRDKAAIAVRAEVWEVPLVNLHMLALRTLMDLSF